MYGKSAPLNLQQFTIVCLCSLSSVLPPSQLARAPSPVRNFTVIVNFDVSRSIIIANLSWIGPERPYGKIDHYKIVLSSARAASLIGSKSLPVQVCIDVPMTTPPTGNGIHDHLPC